MRPELQAVLFDLDGTLVDSAPDLGAAADQLRTDRGMPSLDLALYRPMCGAGARGMLAVAFDITPEHPDFPALRAEFLDNYERRLTRQTLLFDGVADVVQALRQHGLAWGVATNKASRFSVPLTRSMPVFASLGALVSGDTTPHSKPHPAPLLEAARQLGVDPSRCVYVGDDERDIIAGRAAGMATVVATYGYLGQAGPALAWGADACISTPLELLPLVISASGLK